MSHENWVAARIRDNLEWVTNRPQVPAHPDHESQQQGPVHLWKQLENIWWAHEEGFVRGVYWAILNREADEEGLRYHLNHLQIGVPRAEVVRHFVESDEGRGRGVSSDWFGEMYYYAASLPLIDTRWLISLPEDKDFLIHAYRRILGREPDATAIAAWGKPIHWPLFRRRRLLRTLLNSEERKLLLLHTERLQTTSRMESGTQAVLDQISRVCGRIQEVENKLNVVGEALEPLSHAQLSQLRQLRQIVQAQTAQSTQSSRVSQDQLAQLTQQVQAQQADGRLDNLTELTRLLVSQVSELSQFSQLPQLLQLSQSQLSRLDQLIQGTQSLSEREQIRWWRQEQHVFEQQATFDKLRIVCASVLKGINQPALKPDIHAKLPNRDGCRICNGELKYRWTKQVLNNKYEAEYHECQTCHSLQIPNPTWLEEAYSDEYLPRCWNPDRGRFHRVFSVYCYLCALHEAGLTAPTPKFLDFGGGQGLLTQMLYNGGHDAWTCDAFVPHPIFAEDRSITDLSNLKDHSIDVLTSFEVFEHLTDPQDVMRQLRRVLKPGGIFLVSSEIYDTEKHGPNWHYLSTEFGQHVTFWSRAAMEHIGAEYGFESVGFFPSNEGFCTLFHFLDVNELREGLARAREIVRSAEFLDRVTRRWELTRCGYVTFTPQPDVVSIPNRGGLRCAS